VSAAPAFATNWLSHRIADFQAKNPTIDLELDASARLVDLSAGDADVGIRGSTRAAAELVSGCHFAKLFSDEIFPLCSPDYLQEAGPFEKPADLAKARLLRNPTIEWKPWFEAADLDWPEPAVGPKFGDVTTLLDSAANGAGIALAGRIASLPLIRSRRLVRVFDLAALSKLEYFAVCLPKSLKRPEVAAFLDWVVSEAKEDVFKGAEDRLQHGLGGKAIVENLAAAAVYVEGDRLTLNKAAEEITGYKRGDIRTVRDWFGRLYARHREKQARALIEDANKRAQIMRGGIAVRKDGTERYFEYSTFPHAAGEVWLINDVTERKAAEKRMQQLAYHDHLTSLPNRLMFTEQLRRALGRAVRRKRHVGIFFIDLDGFKRINDELGHEAGDRVLKEMGRRLVGCIRQEDTAARFGGDEFAILLDEVQDRQCLASLAGRILKAVGQPISFGSEQRSVGASIGISAYPEDGEDLAQLMKQADLAMYDAKARGKNCYSFFSELKERKDGSAILNSL
jgi:diguanylate cyclase (GGDEF)-like protein/PAS domain S-box-containing protein